MQFLNTIQTFFSKNKINFLYILSFIAVFFMLGDNAWADPTDTGPAPKTDEQKSLESINLFFQMLAVILTLFTNLVGWFLSPEWTNGSLLGMDNMLKDLWLYVSNVVYFIFAMLFIWIALMNIIGKDGDNYKLKQAIPKFIVGVLIVPFSWFIVQFVISASNVLTVAVLSIPYNDFQGYMNDKNGKQFEIKVCSNGYVVKTKTSQKADPSKAESQAGRFIIECNSSSGALVGSGPAPEPEPTSITNLFTQGDSSALGLMYVYTYAVMKIDNTDKLFAGEVTSGLNDLMGIIFKYGFSLIILIAYALLLLALGFALFVRVVWLWFFAILSPVFGLLYFFDKKEGAGEGAMKNLSFTELLSVALVPVYVSAALSFGFLFMKVADTGFGSGGGGNGGNITSDCFTPLGISKFRLCWDAPSIPGQEQGKTLFEGSLATLIGQFFGLIFLWMAVMAALKSSNITKEVVQPIADFGASVGQIIQKGPANLPIIPVPDGKGGMTGMSAKGLASGGGQIQSALEQASASSGNVFADSAKRKFGLMPNTETGKIAELTSKSVTLSTDQLKAEDFKKRLGEFDYTEAIKNSAYKENMKSYFKKVYGVDMDFKGNNLDEWADSMKNNQDMAKILKAGNMFDDDLDNKLKATAGNKIGENTATTAGTTTASSATKVSPIAGNVSTSNSKVAGQQTTTIKIEGGPELKKQGQSLWGDENYTKVTSYTVNQNTVGTMTKNELEKWLDKKLELNDADKNEVMTRVDTAIQQLVADRVIADTNKFWK